MPSAIKVGKGAFADARGVGFGDARDVVDVRRPHARTVAGAARDGIGTRHIRISAEINIQTGALRAFKQDIFARAPRFIQQNAAIGDERFQFFGVFEIGLQHFTGMRSLLRREVAQTVGFFFPVGGDFFFQQFAVEQVAHAHTDAHHFIDISRADAAHRRADFARFVVGFARRVQ